MMKALPWDLLSNLKVPWEHLLLSQSVSQSVFLQEKYLCSKRVLGINVRFDDLFQGSLPWDLLS